MKIDLITHFSVTQNEDVNASKSLFQEILVDGEEIDLAYSNLRDKLIFTNKRMIAYDVKGLTGSKKEFRFFTYDKISSFSVETAGFLDGDSDFKIWVSGVGVFGVKFHKKLDIKQVARYLSQKTI